MCNSEHNLMYSIYDDKSFFSWYWGIKLKTLHLLDRSGKTGLHLWPDDRSFFKKRFYNFIINVAL